MLLRILESTQGMCNGSRLTVRAFQNHVIDAEIATSIQYVKIKLRFSCNKRDVKYFNSLSLYFITNLDSNSLEPIRKIITSLLAII